jgi:predicted metal-dependent phosphoesterase TrpH
VERHPHLAHPLPAGRIRVDLHTHTMWSGDSTTTPDEVRDAVVASGIDVLCITDHHEIAGAVRLRSELPCRVVVGEEVRTQQGEIIGLFLTERVPFGLTPVDTARLIRDQGGIVYIPHPFDPMRRNLAEPAIRALADHGLLDAMEGLNAKTSLRSLNRQASEVAAELGVAVGAGSDAHVPDALGAAYVEIDDLDLDHVDAPGTFLMALRSATVVGHHWDHARPWRPRIVPSTK